MKLAGRAVATRVSRLLGPASGLLLGADQEAGAHRGLLGVKDHVLELGGQVPRHGDREAHAPPWARRSVRAP
jgi:hypothetical protein